MFMWPYKQSGYSFVDVACVLIVDNFNET